MAPISRSASSIACQVRSCSVGSMKYADFGLIATLRTRWTVTARPFSAAIMPQHSRGDSSRAWATISSRSCRAMIKLLDGGGLPADRGGLVLVVVFVVVGDPVQRVLELAHPLAHGAAHLGQLLRTEDDQRDHQHDDELHRADASRHVCVPSPAWLAGHLRVSP